MEGILPESAAPPEHPAPFDPKRLGALAGNAQQVAAGSQHHGRPSPRCLAGSLAVCHLGLPPPSTGTSRVQHTSIHRPNLHPSEKST